MGIVSSFLGFDDAVDNFNSGMSSSIRQSREAGFQILDRLNESIANNRKEFVNHAKDAMLEVLSQMGDKTKQDALDIIEIFTYNLSNIAESAIEQAQNATIVVFDNSLRKVRYEADMFVEHLVTNRFFILIGILLLIILLLATAYLFRRVTRDYLYCSQLFEVLSNMIIILATLFEFIWFGLSLVWLSEGAFNNKSSFYIITTIIMILAIFYGICHLCWFYEEKISMGWKWLLHKVNERWTVIGSKREYLNPPVYIEI